MKRRAQAGDKGLADLIAIGHRDPELDALRARAYDGLLTLIDAAKRVTGLTSPPKTWCCS